jgi:hypothetical protein
MSKRSPPDGPCRTKATYDHKRPRYYLPSPDRVAVEHEQLAIKCAKTRELNKMGGEAWVRKYMLPERK